jgi:hypothetical protein
MFPQYRYGDHLTSLRKASISIAIRHNVLGGGEVVGFRANNAALASMLTNGGQDRLLMSYLTKLRTTSRLMRVFMVPRAEDGGGM